MADRRSALVARLGAVATGRGDLARPRRRSRFEDAAAPLMIEVHDERDAAPPARRLLDETVVRDEQRGDSPRHAADASAATGRRSVTPPPDASASAPDRGGAVAVPQAVPSSAARTSSRAGPPDAQPVVAEPVVAPGAVASEAISTVAVDTTTVVNEHHHHVERVERHEHRHDTAVTELFQWIEEGAPAATATTGAPETPAPIRQHPVDPANVPAPSARDDVGRPAGPEPATVVRIGRVEVRTVRPEPPAPRRAATPAPLEFAGPTLEEFLGGRP